MGFPSVVITDVKPDAYDDRVMPFHGDPAKGEVLQNLHIATCFSQLEKVLAIRGRAEQIFNRVFSECQQLNERIASLDQRMQDLKEQSHDIQKMMENHSPECFMSVSANEIVSLVHSVPGGLFNRSTAPEEVNQRRDETDELVPLNNFNRFWPCLEIGVGVPADKNWICSHSYTNPRFFFEKWVEDQASWRAKEDEKKEEVKKVFNARREKELEEASATPILPIERHYVDDAGRHYVKTIGEERDLGSYNRVERRFKREISRKELIYGSGIKLEDSDVNETEAYKLKEIEEEIEPEPFVSEDALAPKRLSENPVPNLHKPLDMPRMFSQSMNQYLDTGITPGSVVDENPGLLKQSSIRAIEAIRKGSSAAAFRPNLLDRTLPKVPEDPSQSDIVYSGMKERFESRAEEEGTGDLPRLPARMYKSESVVLDAPPLPSRSPHEQLDDLPELKSTTNVFGEKGSSPRPSTPPRITGFQPGSLEAEEFYKSQSNHPIPPVPPRSSPTPV